MGIRERSARVAGAVRFALGIERVVAWLAVIAWVAVVAWLATS